jgi:hypothetical protein
MKVRTFSLLEYYRLSLIWKNQTVAYLDPQCTLLVVNVEPVSPKHFAVTFQQIYRLADGLPHSGRKIMGPDELLYCPSPDTTEGSVGSRPAVAAPSQASSQPRSARGGLWRTLRRVGCILGVGFLGLMGACIGLLVLVAILAAASGRADLSTGGLGVRGRAVYVESLPSDVDPTYQRAVSDAIAYWHQRLGSSLFHQTATAAEADVQVSWVKEWAGERAGMTADRRVVLVGLGDSNCLGRWRAYAYDTVKQIAIHELGHVLGMQHSPNPADPMYPVLTPKYDLMVDEDKVIPAGWAQFLPSCGHDNPSRVEIELASDREVDLFVVPSSDSYQRLLAGQAFSYYPDCSRQKVRAASIRCTVPVGGGVVLQNRPGLLGSGSPARVQIKVWER